MGQFDNYTPVHIKVKPGSSKDEISFDAGGNLVVKIKEKPTEGAANSYLIKFLAKEFNLSKSEIVLKKGSNSRFKKFLLPLIKEELNDLLEKYKTN